MSNAAHSLEAGSNFPTHKKKRAKRAAGTGGHMSAAAHSLEAGSSFPTHKKGSFKSSLQDF
ncbi:MAG: hypothetical protein FWF77_05895 [Defluviitaleaceae bacterium]|nr:hypothetical protein [Defluviitaleaceae bacterium]